VEGRRQFDFKTALQVHQEEVKAQPFKCADFIAEETDSLWMIEVTDALKADDQQLRQSIAELLGQSMSGKLFKDSLMKLYGTHAHIVDKKLLDQSVRTYFALVVGLPPNRFEAAQRNRIRDEMKRITNRIGPGFHGSANRPIILIETIESWNEKFRDAVEIS